MPPKVKKPKPKPKPKPKAKPKPKPKPTTTTTGTRAVARTTTGPAQATNVVVRIGEPVRRSRAPAKPKGGGDGWYPPFNLSRSGSTFAPPSYNISYMSPPTFAPAPPQENLFTAPRPPPASFTERAGAPLPSAGMDTAFASEDAVPEIEPAPRPKPPPPPPRSDIMQRLQNIALDTLQRAVMPAGSRTDGWAPPLNLSRNGSIFTPPTYKIPYINPPDEDEQISKAIIDAERTLAGIPKTPKRPDWTDIAMSPNNAFIRPTISGKPFLESLKDNLLVEAPEPEPTLAPPVAEAPTFEQVAQGSPAPATPATKPKQAQKVRDLVRTNVRNAFETLKKTQKVDKAFEQRVFKDALGDDYVQNQPITKYNTANAERILARLRAIMPRTEEQAQQEFEYVTPSKSR